MPTAEAASCACMSAVPFAFSMSTRAICALLLRERRLLLVRDLALGQHGHQLGRELDVLDVDAARLDVVRVEVRGDRFVRALLHLGTGLDEAHRLEALQRVAEVVADGRLQHLVHEVLHRADHRDHLRCPRVGHVDLHLQVDAEHEALTALRLDRRQVRVEVVRGRHRVGPVEREDRRRARSRPRRRAG